jgi:DDB1- and CUL4-associated factor 8
MNKGYKSQINDVAFSCVNEILVSCSDDFIYLFQYNMGIGPDPKSVETDHLNSLNQPQAYKGHKNSRASKWVNFFGPDDEYVLSGSDCGNIFVWRKKGGKLMRMMSGHKSLVFCVETHPHFPFLATCSTDNGPGLDTSGSNRQPIKWYFYLFMCKVSCFFRFGKT